jgi:hypothetical protein
VSATQTPLVKDQCLIKKLNVGKMTLQLEIKIEKSKLKNIKAKSN